MKTSIIMAISSVLATVIGLIVLTNKLVFDPVAFVNIAVALLLAIPLTVVITKILGKPLEERVERLDKDIAQRDMHILCDLRDTIFKFRPVRKKRPTE